MFIVGYEQGTLDVRWGYLTVSDWWRCSAVMKNICHCQDNCSWGEGYGQSSSVLAGLDSWIWHSGRCDSVLIGDKNIVSVPRHDGLLVDMVNESIQEDLNIACDEDWGRHVTGIHIQHVTRIWIQHVMRIRIQYMTRIRIQHVTRIRIQHVMRIRILHVTRIHRGPGFSQVSTIPLNPLLMEGQEWPSFCPEQGCLCAEWGKRHTGNKLWRFF